MNLKAFDIILLYFDYFKKIKLSNKRYKFEYGSAIRYQNKGKKAYNAQEMINRLIEIKANASKK